MLRAKRKSAVARFGGELNEEDANPLETVANLSDIMLVLAVALMIVVITHWNVDLSNASRIENDDMEPIASQDAPSSSSTASGKFEEIGTVYQDLETGEMYVVRN